jgi:hypothetical protein
MGARSTWPFGPAEGSQYSSDDITYGQLPQDQEQQQEQQDQEPAHAIIGEIARLLRETRGNMLVAASMLGSITIGMALEARFAGRALQPDMFRALNVFLLLGLICCWLRALTLLALAGRPVLNAVSELRWRTGAPLDPRAPWLTLPPVGDDPEQWTWIRAHLLVGAARLARYRIHLADTWTYITAIWFVAWTVIIIMGF